MTGWTWLLLGAAQAAAPTIPERWRSLRDTSVWRSPTPEEHQAARWSGQRLAALARQDPACPRATLDALAAELRPHGLDLEVDDGRVLLHDASAPRGTGLLVVRCGDAAPWVWQAPHALHDLHTRTLALDAFEATHARAVMLSTVHRYRASVEETPSDPVHPADVTRQPGSLFHALGLGLLEGDDALRVVQLHGFADRPDLPFDLVASPGRTPWAGPPPQWPEPLRAARYGIEVHELGGTQNVQGHAFPHRFLHLELSATLRRSLLDDPARQALVWSGVPSAW